MKIYINHDGQTLGPFSQDEVRSKIYSGELARTASACVEGSTDWHPLEQLLSDGERIASPASPQASVTLGQLRDPKEKTALIWLYIASVPAWLLLILFVISSAGALLLIIGFIELLHLAGRLWFAAYLKTNAVRVSEAQLPEVHRIVQASCERLGMEMPEVYVMQQNV